MELLKLVVVFILIVFFLWRRRPLYQALLAGIVATGVLYTVMPMDWLRLTLRVVTGWDSISLLLIIYLITFIQQILERRSQIKLAQRDLDRLFNNRRVNASIAPLFIGLLPSAAAMILCGDIVKESTDGYLDPKEQAFVTSWFRHIPESILPTYTGVLLMSSLSGVDIASFIVGMTPPVLMMAALGYILYLRKLPRDTGGEPSDNKLKDLLNLFKHLWVLFLVIFLILAFNMSVIMSVSIVIVLALFIYRIRPDELKVMVVRSFEKRMLGNTFLILVFKEFISHTGVIGLLPEFFSQFPIPLFLIFSLVFFFGGIISGNNGIIALGTTMAFTSIPDAGMPLMVLLMCMCHAASQLSPTHICLAVATEYFGVTMGDLVRKTIPVTLIVGIFSILYYQLLLLLV